ncbi:MAG: outer membrane protein assembly factor BamA [Deltaproteobacteria bacterium]
MRRRRTAALVALSLLLFSAMPPGIGFLRAAGFPVLAIEVRGAKRVGADAVRAAMGTRVGEEFDPVQIRRDVKAIYRMGYFSDVRVDAEPVPGGTRLTVIVEEKPIVSSVVIEGNREVDTKDLREALTVKERTLFTDEKVKESERKMVEVFQNRGFYDASVVSSVREEPDGSIRVAFRVTEGEKQKITKIAITGNRAISTRRIRKVMETKEKGFFSFLTDSGTFKKDVLDADIHRIEALYQNNGYLESKVSDPLVERKPGGLSLTIHVYEGRAFKVGTVRFSGESGVSEDALRSRVTLGAGETFSREKLLADVLGLTTLLNDRGYALALVSPGVEKRKDEPVADITYRIERGDRYRFGRVEIAGNTKTLDRVIRRNLDVADGQIYTATGLKTSRENLNRLSFFKDVKISTTPSPEKREMDVRVEVQEGPTGTLSGGLGFSSIDKLFGVIQVNENNLFGRAWRASLNSQFGARRTVFTLNFSDPYFLDTDYSIFLSAYNQRIDYTDFERKGTGGKVGVGRSFGRDVTASLAVRVDDVQVLDPGDSVSQILKEEFSKGTQQTRSLTFSLVRDTTDRRFDPSRGSVASASVEYAGGPLGGDLDFVKYFLNGKIFHPVTKSTVLSGNLLWGHTVSTVGGRVPIFERFFLGGPYSIRGFKQRTLSPVDPNTDEEIGGNKELVANIEYTFPLFNEIGFKGVLFFDAGNTWSQDEWPWKMKPWNGPPFRYAAGFGLRWYSPMGPLRFEWGWNLNPEPGESKRVAEFTIGTAF